MYAMPTPGMGYKAGIEVPMRELDPDHDDGDRSPSPAIAEMVSRRIARILPGVSPVVTGTSVCTWTYGPDGHFVIDTALDGRLVYACGDSGEGFKFAALMGESLADLAEGGARDADLGTFSLDRFDGHLPEPPTRMHLGE
jgi:glycine/D-amino acid oxidase-like deaminating enzyme